MARNMYGATSADFTLTSGGRVVPGATLTIWSARTGGTQITDLLDVDSVATTTVTSDADGSIVYYGPNNDKTVHWADSGVGNRIAVRPTDITGDPPVLSIGTVGTGAAAASLTGTSEAPVLNLTLPTAGANGVDTAAIQDGAVTAAKLGSDVRIGNLLSSNQASLETDASGWTHEAYCTVARSTSEAAVGSASLAATCNNAGGGYLSARTSSGTSGIPVTAGETYTAVASVKSGAARAARVELFWYNSGGTFLSSTSVNANNVTTSTSAWTEMKPLTAVAPTSAAYAAVVVTVISPALSEVHYIDKIGFWRGAAGQWALPGTPVPGQSHIATNGAVHLSGTGSPEGVVTAAPGSTWLQTDATTDVKGWIRWMKATGTGNTGWQVGPEADTGLRNIASIIDADWAPYASSGYLSLRRIGQTVTLVGQLERVTASGTRSDMDAVVTVPTGFVPQSAWRAIGQAVYYVSAAAANIGYLGDVASADRMDVIIPSGGTWAAGDGVFIEASWITADAWPSSLPGSAA